MPIPVVCVCGNRWEVSEKLLGKRILCVKCDERVSVRRPKNVKFRARCPKFECSTLLTLALPESASGAECRCTECSTIFELNLKTGKPTPEDKIAVRCGNPDCGKRLRLPKSLAEDKRRCPACKGSLFDGTERIIVHAEQEEEIGTYGVASETSLSFILTREANGHRLTPAQVKSKEHLINERILTDPGRCPACQQKWNRKIQQCRNCMFDLESGRVWTKKGEQPTDVVPVDDGFDSEAAAAAAEAAGEVLGQVISSFFG